MTHPEQSGHPNPRRRTIPPWWMTIRSSLRFSRPLPEQPISLQAQVVFFRELEILLKAGIPLAQALWILEKEMGETPFGAIVSKVRERLMSGETLSMSFSGFPNAFPPRVVAMLASGAASGMLEGIFGKLASSCEFRLRAYRKIVSSLVYPGFILLTAMAFVLGLVCYVLPSFAQAIASLDAATGSHSQPAAHGPAGGWPWVFGIAGGLGLAAVGAMTIRRSLPTGSDRRRAIELLVLALPGIGPLARKLAAFELCHTLEMLHASGLPITKSLRYLMEVFHSQVVREELERALAHVTEGGSLSHAFKEARLFPPLIGAAMAVGETTGDLVVALKGSANYFHMEVTTAAERIEALIEPLFLSFFGLLVGIFVLKLFIPVYNAIGIIGGKS